MIWSTGGYDLGGQISAKLTIMNGYASNVECIRGIGVGVVIKVHGDTIAIQDTPKKEYIVPKDTVEGFDGNEVCLKLTKKELEKYETTI
jgi:Uncharacterized protein conserved in bacteria (DUF2171)